MILLDISSGWQSFFQLISVFLIFLFVLFITYAVTKWIAGYQKGIMMNRNIQIIETFRISNNKYIQIMQVGSKYLVVSVCKDSINVLTELTEEQLTWKPSEEEKTENDVKEKFQDILSNLKEKFPKK